MNITDSYALGNVIGHRVSGANNSGIDVGGLVGFSQGQIVGSNRELIPALIDGQDDFLCGFSFATGQVSGYGNVGGLVGRTNASVNNTFAGWWNENSRAVKEGTSTVTARDMNDNLVPVGVDNSLLTGNNFGGLVGQLGNVTVTTARLTWSYSVGDVIAPMRNNSNTNTACNVGGLVGDVYGNISTSWAQGSIYGNQCVGGLAGRAATSVQITQCYFTGTIVEGANFVGGLLGQGGNQILYCYSSTKVLLSWSSGQAAGIYGGDTGKPLINYNFVIGSLDLSGGTNGGAIAVHTSMANINAGNWRWAGYVSSTNIPNNNEKNINGAPLSADALRNPGTYGLTDQLGEILGSGFTNFGTWGGRDWIYNSSKLQFPLLGFGPEQPYIPFLYYLFGANYPIVYGNDLFGAEITGIDFNQARAIVSSDIPPVIPTKKHDDYDVTIQISEIFQVDASSSVAGQYDKSGAALSDYTYELIGSTNEALKGQKPEIIVSWSEEFRIHETTRICYSDGYITLKFNSMNPLPNYLASMTPQNNVFDMKSNAFKTYLGENYRFRATEKSTNGQQFDTGNLYIAPKEITVQGEVTDKMWDGTTKAEWVPNKGPEQNSAFFDQIRYPDTTIKSGQIDEENSHVHLAQDITIEFENANVGDNKKVITNGDVGLTGSHANNYRLVFDIGTARITPFDIAKAPMIDFRQGRTVTRSYSAGNLVAEIEIAPEVLIYYNSTDFFKVTLDKNWTVQYQDENAGTDKQVMKILNPSGDEVSNFILSYNGDENFDWSKIFSPHHPEQTELMNQLMQIFLSGTLSPEALIESIDLTPDSTKINHYDASNLQDKKSPVDDNGEWTAPQETPPSGEWVAWKDGIITPAFAQWISGRLNQKTYDGTPFILKSSVMVDELDDNGQPIYENDKVKQKIDLNAVGALPTLSVASGQIQFDYAFDFIELDLGELTEKIQIELNLLNDADEADRVNGAIQTMRNHLTQLLEGTETSLEGTGITVDYVMQAIKIEDMMKKSDEIVLITGPDSFRYLDEKIGIGEWQWQNVQKSMVNPNIQGLPVNLENYQTQVSTGDKPEFAKIDISDGRIPPGLITAEEIQAGQLRFIPGEIETREYDGKTEASIKTLPKFNIILYKTLPISIERAMELHDNETFIHDGVSYEIVTADKENSGFDYSEAIYRELPGSPIMASEIEIEVHNLHFGSDDLTQVNAPNAYIKSKLDLNAGANRIHLNLNEQLTGPSDVYDSTISTEPTDGLQWRFESTFMLGEKNLSDQARLQILNLAKKNMFGTMTNPNFQEDIKAPIDKELESLIFKGGDLKGQYENAIEDWDQFSAILISNVYQSKEYSAAEIIPRELSWTPGRVAGKRYDGTKNVYEILSEPELRHVKSNGQGLSLIPGDGVLPVRGWAEFDSADLSLTLDPFNLLEIDTLFSNVSAAPYFLKTDPPQSRDTYWGLQHSLENYDTENLRNEARLYFTHRANTSEINAKAQAYFDGEHPEHYFHADKLISLKERRYQMNPSNYLPLFDNFEAWKSAGNMGTTYLNWSNEQKTAWIDAKNDGLLSYAEWLSEIAFAEWVSDDSEMKTENGQTYLSWLQSKSGRDDSSIATKIKHQGVSNYSLKHSDETSYNAIGLPKLPLTKVLLESDDDGISKLTQAKEKERLFGQPAFYPAAITPTELSKENINILTHGYISKTWNGLNNATFDHVIEKENKNLGTFDVAFDLPYFENLDGRYQNAKSHQTLWLDMQKSNYSYVGHGVQGELSLDENLLEDDVYTGPIEYGDSKSALRYRESYAAGEEKPVAQTYDHNINVTNPIFNDKNITYNDLGLSAQEYLTRYLYFGQIKPLEITMDNWLNYLHISPGHYEKEWDGTTALTFNNLKEWAQIFLLTEGSLEGGQIPEGYTDLNAYVEFLRQPQAPDLPEKQVASPFEIYQSIDPQTEYNESRPTLENETHWMNMKNTELWTTTDDYSISDEVVQMILLGAEQYLKQADANLDLLSELTDKGWSGQSLYRGTILSRQLNPDLIEKMEIKTTAGFIRKIYDGTTVAFGDKVSVEQERPVVILLDELTGYEQKWDDIARAWVDDLEKPITRKIELEIPYEDYADFIMPESSEFDEANVGKRKINTVITNIETRLLNFSNDMDKTQFLSKLGVELYQGEILPLIVTDETNFHNGISLQEPNLERLLPEPAQVERLYNGTKTIEQSDLKNHLLPQLKVDVASNWGDPEHLGSPLTQTISLNFDESWKQHINFDNKNVTVNQAELAQGKIVPINKTVISSQVSRTFDPQNNPADKSNVWIDNNEIKHEDYNVILTDSAWKYLEARLFTGKILPAPLEWAIGQTNDRLYDQTTLASIHKMPELQEVFANEVKTSFQLGELQTQILENIHFYDGENKTAEISGFNNPLNWAVKYDQQTANLPIEFYMLDEQNPAQIQYGKIDFDAFLNQEMLEQYPALANYLYPKTTEYTFENAAITGQKIIVGTNDDQEDEKYDTEKESYNGRPFTIGQIQLGQVIERAYDGTKTAEIEQKPVITTVITDENGNEQVIDLTDFIRFDQVEFDNRHVGEGKSIKAQISLKEISIDGISYELTDALKQKIENASFLGTISPRQIYWTTGQIAAKQYDREVNVAANLIHSPDLQGTEVNGLTDGILAIDQTVSSDTTKNEIVNKIQGMTRYENTAGIANIDVAYDLDDNVIPVTVTATNWGISGDNASNYQIIDPSHSIASVTDFPAQIGLENPVAVQPTFEALSEDDQVIGLGGLILPRPVHFVGQINLTKSYDGNALLIADKNQSNWSIERPEDGFEAHNFHYASPQPELANASLGIMHQLDNADQIILPEAHDDVAYSISDLLGHQELNGRIDEQVNLDQTGQLRHHALSGRGKLVGKDAANYILADNELANVQTLISKASGPEIVLNPLKINADSFTVEPTFYDTHGPAIVLPNQLPSDEDIKASALFALDPVAQVAPSTFSPQHTAVYRLSTSNNITSISTYSADPSLWQTSSTFTNLQPNTQYYLYAQAIESRNFFEGPISQLLLVSTDSKGSPTLSILPNQKGFLAQTGDIPQFLIEGALILFLAFLINEKKKRDKEENLTNDE